MTAIALFVALTVGQTAESHVAANPVYRHLQQTGIFPGKEAGKLPAPTMPDGLTKAQQREILDKLARPRHKFETLTRKSVVAPHIASVDRVDNSDPKRPIQSIEFYFVAHADLDAMDDKDFLDSLLTADDTDGSSLSEAELKERGIQLSHPERESYGQIVFPLLKKVRLHATGHSFWSRTSDSILTAATIDSRFDGDAKYPNQWRPLDKEGNAGAASTYTGAGLYMKLTKLHDPPGTVFVECHIRGVEPFGWFNGVNLLRSKLPPAIQRQVRTARRNMMKLQAAKKEPVPR